MLHPLIQLKESPISGKGLFAVSFIREGEIIWRQDPHERHYGLEEIQKWSLEKQKLFFSCSYQVGDNLFYGMDGSGPDEADFMNHSCDPNTWFIDDKTMVARRDILPNEEITYDYVTSEIRADFGFRCQCKSNICRKFINNQNLVKFPFLVILYKGHFMSHVVRYLKNLGIEV